MSHFIESKIREKELYSDKIRQKFAGDDNDMENIAS